MQKIVFNAHYLMYFDTAMGDYWRALALPYEAAMQQLGGDLYVKKAVVEYHASARYDDQLDIGLQCARIGNSSLQFRGAVFRGDELLIEGELVYVFADPATQTSRPVPAALRDVLSGFEAGEPMLSVRLDGWAELKPAARQVRTEVFLQEQHIPIELEWDDADASATHAVAFNRLGMPLATGRLLPPQPADAPGVARIGRMAVSRVLRGSGVGRQVLLALEQAARARGVQAIELHAQRSAEGFYARQGYAIQGEPFDEAGIAHVVMVKPLTDPST